MLKIIYNFRKELLLHVYCSNYSSAVVNVIWPLIFDNTVISVMLYYFTLYLIFILANKAVVSKNYSKFSLQNCLVTQNNTFEV